MAGPAYSAAAEPVNTKIPAPMTAPIPSVTRLIGPSARFKLCSLVSPASLISTSSDFVANKGLPMQLLLQKVTCSVYPKTAKLDAVIVVAEALSPYKNISYLLKPLPTKAHRKGNRPGPSAGPATRFSSCT